MHRHQVSGLFGLSLHLRIHLPTGSTCWISFAPVFSFIYSPYLCFISFLYLALYVLGDDALIR